MKKILSIMLVCALLTGICACEHDDPAAADGEGVLIAVDPDTGSHGTGSPGGTDTCDPGTGNASPTATEAPSRPSTYERLNDDDVYDLVLGDYAELCTKADSASSNDKRIIYLAQAEACLLDSAVMIPVNTEGGVYTISRIAPGTVPFVQWGNAERLQGLIISDEFCTPEERADMIGLWEKAVDGGSTYDPDAYLISKGHTLKKEYNTTFSKTPATIDWLNTSSRSDTEITVNCVDGLVEYNNLGQMAPALAESWSVSGDGITYTFNIRKGVYWYDSAGKQVAELTAGDFEAGFRHMLDAQAGPEQLVLGVVRGAQAYCSGNGSWEEVGYKEIGENDLQITLEKPCSYFLSMLTASCFLPVCESFYLSCGGVFGVEEFASASSDTQNYTFGRSDDVSSQVYCGPFLLKGIQEDSEILLVRNEHYYRNDETMINTVKWIFDDGSDPDALYDDTVAGVYAGITLEESSGLLQRAKDDGIFDRYHYISDTSSVTYFAALNVNRGTFVLENGNAASGKTEDQKIDTQTALLNRNFRKAILHAFDKGTWNAVSRGDDLKEYNLRNMYTHPEFVKLLSGTADDEGHTFPAGTYYGEIVRYYADRFGAGIDVSDGTDGWYRPEEARKYLEAAVQELGNSVIYPVQIDVFYLSSSEISTGQTAAFKRSVEDCLGAEYVLVNLIEAATPEDYYSCGFGVCDGRSGNFDVIFGSGWIPDHGDPSTYLETFLSTGCKMKAVGLY